MGDEEGMDPSSVSVSADAPLASATPISDLARDEIAEWQATFDADRREATEADRMPMMARVDEASA